MSSQTPQSDPFYIRLLKFLGPYVLSAGGLAGGYGVAQKITQNPALQIGIAIIAGFLGYALSFINKVWQKLEDPLVDKIAAWIPSFLKNSFAGYRRHYLTYLSRAHRVVEFSGLMQRPAYNREIARIFVEPAISPVAPHLASSHLLKDTQLSTSDSHAIWHYLSDNMLSSDVIVLLGAAGSGKSTLLKYIAFSLSQARLRTQLLRRHRLRQFFPVLLYLRDHAATIKDKPACTLPELLQSSVQSKGHLSIPAQWFEQQLKRGSCLVMLDGLDETADEETRRLVVQWLQGQLLSYPENRFIITARPYGYVDTSLDDAIVLKVQPFSSAQIQSFIKQWFLIDELMRSEKHDPGVQLRAAEGAGKLLATLHQKRSLWELAANPLLLTMIATLASTGGSLPNDRLQLYHEIFQVLLYRRRDAIGLTPKLPVQQKLEVLQPLAFSLMQQRLLEIDYDNLCQLIAPQLAQISTQLTPAEFLQDIEQNSGLLLEINTDSWGFAHKTLQEYLVATHLREEREEDFVLKHVDDDWWHETICFYCAQADATRVIQACLAPAATSVQMLNLALECHSQKLRVDPAVTQKIEELLQTGVEDADLRKCAIVAEVLLKRRLNAMVYFSDDIYIDTSPVSCAEYQLFLDDQRAHRRYYHPWHWSADSFQPGQGREPILGVEPSDVQAFCDWLTKHDNGLWRYRLPDKDEADAIVSRLDKAALPRHEVGFWSKEDEFIWINKTAPEYKNLEALVLDQLLVDRAKALNYDRVRAGDKREAIDEALELERKLNDAQALDINSMLVHGIRVHPLFLEFLFFRADFLRATTRTEASTFLRSLSLLNNHLFPSYAAEKKHLLWFIRYQGQVQARHIYFSLQNMASSSRSQPLLRQHRQEKTFLEQQFAFYCNLCTDLVLLELRVRGKIAPWEGIVLVKERVNVDLY